MSELKDLKDLTLWTLWESPYGQKKVSLWEWLEWKWFDQTLSKWNWWEMNEVKWIEWNDGFDGFDFVNPMGMVLWVDWECPYQSDLVEPYENVPIKMNGIDEIWMNWSE
jgi:hypothetical protein